MSFPAAGGAPDLEPAAGRAEHRHFGYWIDRGWRRARCYECGFQFAGTDDTAENWQSS